MSGLVEPVSTPTLVTLPGVQIAEVGEEWQLSTGPLTLEPVHLQAAADAFHNDPAVHAPRVRFGHTTEWPEASEPAFGTYQNLQVINDGMTLIGDLTGVPEWFADIAPAAYPNRSMDGWTNATTHTGKTHALIIEAVSFLGVIMPGISTLEDLAAVWASEPPQGTQVLAGEPIHATIRGGKCMAKPAAAAVGTDTLRKEFYNEFAQGDRYWWWIRQTFLDPALLIVDDDEGGLWAVEYTISGDSLTFSEPQEVITQYVYKEDGKVAAAAAHLQAGGHPAAEYVNAADSRPDDRNKEANKMGKKQAASTTLELPRADVLKRLGLPEDASDDDITAALAAEPESPETPAPDETPDEAEQTGDENADKDGDDTPDDTDGDDATATVTVPKREWEQSQATTKKLAAESKQREAKRRDGVVAAAVKEGRVARAHSKAWRTQMDVDPEGTEKLLTASEDKGGLPKNMVPVDETGVADGDAVDAATDATQQSYYETHFPELAGSKGGKE